MKKSPFSPAEWALWGLCAGSILISFLFPLSALPRESLCWFYDLTHIPCPGCGLTRAFLCLSHGQWAEAWTWNPFGYIWYVLAWYGTIRPLVHSRAAWISRSFDELLNSKLFFPALIGLMFFVWAVKFGTFFI